MMTTKSLSNDVVKMQIDYLPVSTNAIWSTYKGRIILSKSYRKFLSRVKADFFTTELKQLPFQFCDVTLFLSPPTKRDFDVDNRYKSFFDALTSVKFWNDDSCVSAAHSYKLEGTPGGLTIAMFRRSEKARITLNEANSIISLQIQKQGIG